MFYEMLAGGLVLLRHQRPQTAALWSIFAPALTYGLLPGCLLFPVCRTVVCESFHVFRRHELDVMPLEELAAKALPGF